MLALKLLQANEMDKAPTVLLDLAGEQAARELVAGKIDAAFLMGDSATPQVMRSLREVPGIELMSFRQADGYLRKFRFLSKLTLPEGAMDLAATTRHARSSSSGRRWSWSRATISIPRCPIS